LAILHRAISDADSIVERGHHEVNTGLQFWAAIIEKVDLACEFGCKKHETGLSAGFFSAPGLT
jgi:hypothetical protein